MATLLGSHWLHFNNVIPFHMGQTQTRDYKHGVDKDKKLKEKWRAMALEKVGTKKTITGAGRRRPTYRQLSLTAWLR